MALDKFQPYLFVSAGEQSNKYLTPVISPDGIASFQAQRAQDITGLTVRIDPIQEGTGDPSPTNIRPISGRTGLTVTRCGKNLIDDSVKTAQSSATVVIGQTSTTGFDIFLPAGTYAVTFASEKNPSINYRLSTESSGAHAVISYGNRSGTFTLTESAYLRMWAYLSGGIVPSDITWFQLEAGSTATPYTPYVAPTTYPITWSTEAGTVYGGTLDVVSGVLTVDWDYIASYDGETLPGKWISDRDVYEEGTTPTAGAEVAYKLAEPVTYQLTPTDVKTLAGYNQIYSDAGPIIDIKF